MELPSVGVQPRRRFLVAGVTCDGGEYDPTNSSKYPPSAYIPIPYAADGSCPTTFHLPSAAYAEFVQGFFEDELEPTEGLLDTEHFDDLVLKLKACVAAKQKRPDA